MQKDFEDEKRAKMMVTGDLTRQIKAMQEDKKLQIDNIKNENAKLQQDIDRLM